MPICRHQIRGELGLADPELYRAADRDDPEAVLEGVAMAGLVGVLRQLGDLAEFAAEIFHDLHEEVMATAARGHGLMLRVQQLEEEFPSMEKSFLTHTSLLQNASMAGFEWHSNLRLEQSLVASGDLPRFIMDSYEECRGPPRLFLLDKFDVAGAGACLKRYSDPSFFKTEFSSWGNMKADVQKERKIRKSKRKGMHYKGGDDPDFFTSSKFSSMLQDGRFNEPSNFSGKNTFHVVKLKRRSFIDSSFNSRNKKLYMEQIFKVPSPELKPVYEKSLVYSSLESASIDNNEAHDEIHEISLMDPGIKETPVERNGRNTKPTSIDYNHELVRGHSLSKSDNDFKTVVKVSTLPEARPKDVIVDGYNSDSNTSGVDNFMDALATMDSELEASLQNRLKSEKNLLSIPSQGLDSDSNDEQAEFQDHLSDSYSAGSSSVSYEWKEALKKKGSSHSTSDTPSSVDELLSSNENLSRVNFASDNPSSLTVDAQHGKLIAAVQVPNEASSRFFNTDSAPDHPEHILVSPHVLSTSDEDHTSDLSSNAGKVNGHVVAGSKNLSVLSRCIFNAAENAQTLDSVGRTDTTKYSSLEDNSSDNQNTSKCYETSVNAELVRDPSRSEIVVNELIEKIQPMVEEKPNLLMDRDASHEESISLSLPQSNNVDSHGLNILRIKNVSQFTKSEQFMNNENKEESTSVDELEDVSEPEVATFSSQTPKDKDSPQVLTDESEHIHFHDVSGHQLIVDNSEVLDENDSLKLYSVPDISISLMNAEPKVINSINLHDRVDTDKCGSGREVLSGLSSSEEHQQLDKVGVICSIPMVSSGDNDSCREYTSEGSSGQQKPETIELLSLDSSSSYLNKVDPVTTGFSDEIVNERKVEEIAPSVMKNYEQDAPVAGLSLSGSTLMMHDSLILNSSSGSVNLSNQMATESHLYSLNTLEAPTPLTEPDKDTGFPQHRLPATTDASDTVHDSVIGIETRFISSTKPKMDPEVDVTPPTSLPVLPDVLSELESGKGNSECPQETRLEYSCEDIGKVELPECTVETPKAGPSNHVAEEPSDNISFKQSTEGMFQASDVHPEHPIDVEEACQQNLELPNGRNLNCSVDLEIPQMLNENYQTSGSHSSHMSSYVYLEHTEGLDQTLERQISDDSQIKVDDATALKYSFQAMKQTLKDANSSVLQAMGPTCNLKEFNSNLKETQIVQQQSEGVPVECVESLTEKVPVRLHQHTLEDPYEGLNPNLRGHLDVPSTPLLRESEARIAFPSWHNTQTSIPAMTSSGVMFPSFDSSVVKSATPISSDQDTMPPLPPLPPLQWRSGKLQLGSSNFLPDEGSSTLSFSPPLDASEDSRPHDFQASADTNILLTNPFIDERVTKGADNSEPMIMSSKSLVPVTESRNVEYDPLGIKEQAPHAINPFASLGYEEPQHGPNQIGEQYVPEVLPMHAGTDEEPHHNLVTPGGKQNAPEVSPKQTGTDEEPEPNVVTSERDVGPSVNSFASIWIEENERPASRMVLPRRKDDPLIEAVAAHDRSTLRKLSDRVKSEIKPTTDDRNSLLEQIRTKSFNLKPAATTRPNIQGPKTNLNVVAILEKANAIRQALAGSDDEDDDADNWSDS